MLPEFLRRLVGKDELRRVENGGGQAGGDLCLHVRELAAGRVEALGTIFELRQAVMLKIARHVLRRVRLDDSAVDGHDLRSAALKAMLDDAGAGKLASLQSSNEFWLAFFQAAQNQARVLAEQKLAIRRGALVRRQDASALDSLLDPAPSIPDLFFANFASEALLNVLRDPQLQAILTMRLADHTVPEIAAALESSNRTIERRIERIREVAERTKAKRTCNADLGGQRTKQGRVEEWRGGLGRCLCSLFARSFVRGCHFISTMLRFHSPLIEPDMPN